MPFSLRPDIGNVAAPHLVGYRDIELAIQGVRDIESFYCRSFVGMGAGLFTDQIKLTHQATHFEPTELLTVVPHQRQDAAAARSAATLREQLAHPAAQPKPLDIRRAPSKALGVVTRTGDFKHLAQPINRLMDAQLIDQRVRS